LISREKMEMGSAALCVWMCGKSEGGERVCVGGSSFHHTMKEYPIVCMHTDEDETYVCRPMIEIKQQKRVHFVLLFFPLLNVCMHARVRPLVERQLHIRVNGHIGEAFAFD